jgi:hypothetical protein
MRFGNLDGVCFGWGETVELYGESALARRERERGAEFGNSDSHLLPWITAWGRNEPLVDYLDGTRHWWVLASEVGTRRSSRERDRESESVVIVLWFDCQPLGSSRPHKERERHRKRPRAETHLQVWWPNLNTYFSSLGVLLLPPFWCSFNWSTLGGKRCFLNLAVPDIWNSWTSPWSFLVTKIGGMYLVGPWKKREESECITDFCGACTSI